MRILLLLEWTNLEMVPHDCVISVLGFGMSPNAGVHRPQPRRVKARCLRRSPAENMIAENPSGGKITLTKQQAA